MTVSSNSSSGTGFAGLLTLVFIVLKLCKVIAWSWIWVLSPMWILLAFVLVILLFSLLITVLALIIAIIADNKE